MKIVLLFCALLLPVWSFADEPDKPEKRTEQKIEGWTVRVDDRLLADPNLELGRRAIRLLEARLTDITMVVAPDRLEKLKAVPIVLDLTHGQLVSMQYHPSADWLVKHGYSAELAKCVHIPNVQRFISPREQHVQPWSVLHELAHSYHDQVLGFENPRIRSAWDQYVASGHGAAVLHIDTPGRIPHYALTNHKEFFAEMSEAYFGVNDFFPFTNAELKDSEPEIYALLSEIWGPVP